MNLLTFITITGTLLLAAGAVHHNRETRRIQEDMQWWRNILDERYPAEGDQK